MRKGQNRKKMTLNKKETKRMIKMRETKIIISKNNGRAKVSGKNEHLIIYKYDIYQ